MAGGRAVAPITVGVAAFGLVFGAAAADAGFGVGGAVAFSVFVFAGASQLAAVDLLADGASALVAAATAWIVNARLLMYSASLAPHLGDRSLRDRMWGAYLLTDQAYAVSILAYDEPGRLAGGSARFRYYMGAAVTLWVTWQITTIVGALLGSTVPEEIPLDYSVPLVFLSLVIPAVTDRPTLVAALVGGLGTVLAAEAGAGRGSLLVGALAGIGLGALVDRRTAGVDSERPPS